MATNLLEFGITFNCLFTTVFTGIEKGTGTTASTGVRACYGASLGAVPQVGSRGKVHSPMNLKAF